MAIYFVLLIAKGGVNLLYCSNNSVAATTVLSCSEIPGSFQWVGLRRTRDTVSSGTWNVKFQEAIVVPRPTHGECFVAVGGERVAAVGVDEEHAPCSKRGYGG